tara:strand:- start:225 stop:632 length:408 start_codon:yes stop_codon:yes gene_type:complete
MRVSKKQLRRIIKEEKQKLLKEQGQDNDLKVEFEEIMAQIAELVKEAFSLAGKPEAARRYWYNGMLGSIDPERYGIMSRSYSMADTAEELAESGEEDMMEMGYNDGADGKEAAHPNNEFYMINYKDGQREAEGRP